MKTYSTPELASAARTTQRAIRFWESQGLFGDVERDRLGERKFTGAHVRRAKMISAASMAGMSLEAIKAGPDPVLCLEIRRAEEFLHNVLVLQNEFDL